MTFFGVLKPSWAPDPDTNQGVVAKIATVDRNVERTAARATLCPTARQSGNTGAVVFVQYQASGFKNGHLRVRCSIFDADLHTPLRPAAAARLSRSRACKSAEARGPEKRGLDMAAACGFSDVATRTTDDRGVRPLWISIPPSRSNIRVRVEIYDHHDFMLAYADSPTFRSGVLSSPVVAAATKPQESAIAHVALRSLPQPQRREVYVAAVAVLRAGSASARHRWASVDVRPYPQYGAVRAHTMLVHRRSRGGWHAIPTSGVAPCRVPVEIVAALGLVPRRCPAK